MLLVSLVIFNLSLSGFIYFQFKSYERNFRTYKTMSESYQMNHKYEVDKVYKIINDANVLPNMRRSYIVQGLTFVDGVFVADKVIREIDVPENRVNYLTIKDKKNGGANPEFLTVIKSEDEEKTVLFNSADSLFFYTKEKEGK